MHSAIAFYENRDGAESARQSILMQLGISVRSVISAESHASSSQYRNKFIDDAIAYAAYVGDDAARSVLKPIQDGLRKKLPQTTGRQLLLSQQFAQANLDNVQAALEYIRPNPSEEKVVVMTAEERLSRAFARLQENGISIEGL